MIDDAKSDLKKLSVLFLCSQYYYLHKMSRVRFHAVRELSKQCQVVWSGPEWENWNDDLSAAHNIDSLYKDTKGPDLVLCFKPEEIPGLAEVPYPTAVNCDELQTSDNPVESTVHIFSENKIDLVISHQKKQLEHSLFKELPCHFAYIPYCADTSIFRDYGEEKNIDVLLIGNLAAKRYPLRARLHKYMIKMLSDPRFKNYKVAVYPYPGYRLKKAYTDSHVIDYAKLINASKICLTCSGIHHLKYAKYVEVPACKTMLMADMPCEDQNILKKYLVEIPSDITYEKFTEQVLFYLVNDSERQRLTDAGFSIVHDNFTQEHYAKKFIRVLEEYLITYGHKKLWNY